MKKLLILLTLVALLIGSSSLAYATEDSHKIKSKWDLIGTFFSGRSCECPWDSIVPVGSFWNYEVHIKEAIDGEKSVGVVKFKSGDVEVIGHVKATKTDYAYWSVYDCPPYDICENLAAVGQAEYNGMKYNFMFLYSEGGIWIALSDEPYDTEWSNDTVWLGSLRDYDLLSELNPDVYPFDEKAIHE